MFVVSTKRDGFTIVELLIVIVVIGILAAITIVAFNGVQNRAKTAAVQSSVSQASKKILAYAALNSDQYPATLADADIKDGANGVTYQYTSDNSVSPRKFAVTATSGALSYYSSDKNNGVQEGIAPGHNLVVWNKADGLAGAPLTPVGGLTLDTTVFRTSTASMKIAPSTLGIFLKDSPLKGVSGQTYAVSFWIKTDANWNGAAGNSKIRFGDVANGGALISQCSYEGVKTTWVFISCTRTLTPTVTSLQVTVGNDGTAGNIWIDDFAVTRTE